MFDNRSEFQTYFTPLLNDLDIKSVLAVLKNPQSHDLVERLHQSIFNMIFTKDLDNKVFDHIDIWCENLAYIAWLLRASYNCVIMTTPVFGRYMLFNLVAVID